MLEEFLLKIGFSEEQIQMIQRIYPKRMYSESTLSYNMKTLYHYFKRNTLDNQDFIQIIMTIPNILSSSIENIKLKIKSIQQLGFSKLNTFEILKKYPYLLELNTQKIKNTMDHLEEIGFMKDTIIPIIIKYPPILGMDFSSFQKQKDFFMQYGYSKKDTLTILEQVPSLFDENTKTLSSSLEKYKKMGFHKTEILKITTILPTLFYDKNSSLEEKWKVFREFGYSEMDIIQMIKKVPILLKEKYLEDLEEKLDYLLSFNFSKEDIIFMTCNNPYIFLYSQETLQIKYQGLSSLLKKQTNMVLFKNPILFGYGYQNMEEKIAFYQKIKLSPSLLEETSILTISLDSIKARYHFMKKKLQEEDFFLTDSLFCKKYQITKKDLEQEEQNGYFN